ncbi:hypothetical protein [Mycobacterium sp.]|uniref:hypothetical protein n=1 Tax=Mycobacterium sp. TaxID=1785 RepID=UPI003BA96880
MRATMAFAGLYQLTHEMIKQIVLDKVRDFFCMGAIGLGEVMSTAEREQYRQGVLRLAPKNAFRASLAIFFINGIEMSVLEANLNQHVWNRPAMAGVVRAVADRTRDLLPAVGAVLKELYPDNASEVQTLFSRTITRLEFGIPPDLIDLAQLELGLNRQQLLALKNAGLTDLQAVIDAEPDSLSEVVGGKKVAETLQTVCRMAIELRATTEIDLAPPVE